MALWRERGTPRTRTKTAKKTMEIQRDRALMRSLAEDEKKRLRGATYAGIPLGNRVFVAGLERRFERRLTLCSPGPQPKTNAASP